MDIPVELGVIKFELSTWLIGLYIALVGVFYFLIFRKHHKRNEIELFELVSLVTKFFVVTTVSLCIIVFGIDCILLANTNLETRSDVIAGILTGIVLISGTIIYYIFYIKNALKDYEIVERQENKKRNIKIGEILQLIFFIIMMFMPAIRIPYFIKVFEDKKELITDIVRSFLISFAAMFVLYQLNPLDFKGYLTKKFAGKEPVKEEKKEVVEKEIKPKEETKIKKTSTKKTTNSNKKGNTTKKKSTSKKK